MRMLGFAAAGFVAGAAVMYWLILQGFADDVEADGVSAWRFVSGPC